MKKFMIIAASAALVLSAACTKTEVTRSLNDDEPIIGFSNYAPRSLSKANSTLVNDGALPTGAKIGVFGYSTGSTKFAATENPTFMDETFYVDYGSNTGATATTTNVVRYWPKTVTNLLSFYGYYPYGDETITATPTKSTAGLGTFTFAQKAAVADMVDFEVSNVANDYWYSSTETNPDAQTSKATDGVVPLTFNHMLTKVNFKFKTDIDYSANDTEIKVTSVTLANVRAQGTLHLSYAAPVAPAKLGITSFAWDGQTSAVASTVVPINASGLVLDTTAALNESGSDKVDFLFVPQTLGDDITITINYDVTQGTSDVTSNVATVKLNSVSPTAWNINDFVTYTFILGLKPIKFTATTATWTAVAAGDIEIN